MAAAAQAYSDRYKVLTTKVNNRTISNNPLELLEYHHMREQQIEI